MHDPKVKPIRALARGLEVLRLLQSAGALRLEELHRRSGLPKATLLRILRTLREEGMVWRRLADGAYVPSYALAELAGRMDRDHALTEIASPALERLTAEIRWPSVLAVPRLTHMEVIETNAARAYFDGFALGPVGFRVNMLRSASGRAYLAACPDAEREAILEALRRSGRKGDAGARSPAYVARLLEETRAAGYALRDPDFGGDFDEGRAVRDDGRESLAVAIRLGTGAGALAPGTINVTWSLRVHRRGEGARLFAEAARRTAEEIAAKMSGG